ncbi:MAG: FkbM family methyltransferase [Marinilabiliales bacterium]|nr:MAG: FkbM family methyltransferase [Marinilabiliales bacterium]
MLKEFIRRILIFLHIDVTKNIKYDRLTMDILDKVLCYDSNCIDIGCFKGEILQEFIKRSPGGTHVAFEPIPGFFKALKKKFKSKQLTIHNIALSDQSGVITFNYVIDAPAYSGIKKRDYDGKNPDIELIEVKTDKLDHALPANYRVDLIKIDVEGAEFKVLKGAYNTLKKSKPIIIFEFGLGASDFYKVSPEQFYQYLAVECGYQIYKLKSFLKDGLFLSKSAFIETYNTRKDYYFVASPVE